MNKKLIYILPEASEKTHMKYNVEFITALVAEKNIDIFLILERGSPDLKKIKEKTGVKNIYYTGTNILRIPKLLLYLSKGFFSGYRKVYIHYSFIGSICASLNPFFTTYYWNCGMPWEYKRPFIQELYERLNYKLITHFVTGAHILTNQYSEYYNFNNKKSIVIPNWIDINKSLKIIEQTDREKLKADVKLTATDTTLFFNQRLVERKGAHYILPILQATSDDVKIIITNDGPYKPTLLNQIRENKLEDRVRLLGRVPNEKVLEIMSISDIYILPSEEEGMSHSLMEAFVCSVPAVSFSVGGTLEMYPDNHKEFCVPEKNITLYIEKVIELLQSDSKRKGLAAAQLEEIKEYNKNIILHRFVKEILN